MTTPATRDEHAWALLDQVCDPELPVVSVLDLGIVRNLHLDRANDHVEVVITPTYSGCPALEVIERDIAGALAGHFAKVTVRTVLAPPWTTDWISERGRERLRSAGIAPPSPVRASPAAKRVTSPLDMVARPGNEQVAPVSPECPNCGAGDVERISEFGSTACKSLWRCRACLDPFDHFKPL